MKISGNLTLIGLIAGSKAKESDPVVAVIEHAKGNIDHLANDKFANCIKHSDQKLKLTKAFKSEFNLRLRGQYL